MNKKSSKKKKTSKTKNNSQEYGIILKKSKKYGKRVYPQRGKPPKSSPDYEIV
jgi:hypothetical protein